MRSYLNTKLKNNISNPIMFVAVSLIGPGIVYLNRFLIPDVSFDSVNYHLFLGQRGVMTFLGLFTKQEFFPAGVANTSPIYDIPYYLIYELLGYRLGTSLSVIFLAITSWYCYKIIVLIRPQFFDHTVAIKFCLFASTIFVFEANFELATYYTDIVGVVLLISALYYMLTYIQSEISSSFRQLLISSLLLSVALWGKLVSIIFIVPIFSLLLYKISTNPQNRRRQFGYMLLSGLIIILPLFSTMIVFFLSTGNPVFPLYNGFFHSPYYTFTNYNFSYLGFGGTGLFEKLAYPFISLLYPTKLGEVQALFYDYKLHFYLLIGTGFLVLWRKSLSRLLLILLCLFFSSYFIWAFMFGYIRYAIYIELLGGILLCLFFDSLSQLRYQKFLRFIVMILIIFLNLRSFQFNLLHDYSWRPPLFRSSGFHHQQISHIFDRRLDTSNVPNNLFDQTDFAINCQIPSASYYILSALRTKPLLLLDDTDYYSGFQRSLLYQTKVFEQLTQGHPKAYYNFAVITKTKGLNPTDQNCLAKLNANNFIVNNFFVLNSMLGDTSQQFKIYFGIYFGPTFLESLHD